MEAFFPVRGWVDIKPNVIYEKIAAINILMTQKISEKERENAYIPQTTPTQSTDYRYHDGMPWSSRDILVVTLVQGHLEAAMKYLVGWYCISEIY